MGAKGRHGATKVYWKKKINKHADRKVREK